MSLQFIIALDINLFPGQDSLHTAQLLAQQRAADAAAAAKKKGLKSSLGRIFGKKDKVGKLNQSIAKSIGFAQGLKARGSGGFVTAPLSGGGQQSGGGFCPDLEMVQSDR